MTGDDQFNSHVHAPHQVTPQMFSWMWIRTVGMVFFWWFVVICVYLLVLWPKSSILVSLDHNALFHMVLKDWMYVFANYNLFGIFWGDIKGSWFAIPPCSPDMKNVAGCFHMKGATNSCQNLLQYFNVAVGFLAAYLTSFSPGLPLNFRRISCL